KQLCMMVVDGCLLMASLWLSFALIRPGFDLSGLASPYLVYFVYSAIAGVLIFRQAGLYRSLVLYMGLQSGLVIFKGITLTTAVISIPVWVMNSLSLPPQA